MRKVLVIFYASCAIASAAPDGAEIFKQCAICHGDKAQKHSLNVSALIAGMDAKHIVKTLKAYQAGKMDQYGFGKMMQGQATKLSDEEMQAVAKYVASLPPVKPEEAQKETVPEPTITKEEVDYNSFIKAYFKANPDATFKEAKAKWDESQTQEK